MQKLNIPKAESRGPSGGAGMFRITKPKHTLRVFPFIHEGVPQLAQVEHIHFVLDGQPPVPCEGPGCQYCKESYKNNDRRARRQTKYGMLVVDVDTDVDAVLVWKAATTAYRQIANILEEYGDEVDSVLGNKGIDFIVKYDKNADPSAQYQVMLRVKGSPELEIDESSLPDLLAQPEPEQETDKPAAAAKAEQGSDDDPPEETVVPPEKKADDKPQLDFKDSNGKMHTGAYTGRKKGNSVYIEAEGRLWLVPVANVTTEFPF